MKFLVVLSVALACVVADVSHIVGDEHAPVLRSDLDISPEGNFQYTYETGNGIYGQAKGVLKNPNNEYPSLEVVGAYKYTAPDGSPVEINYIADENGYQPSGPAIPTPHPIPEYIARSLDYIRTHADQTYVAKTAGQAVYNTFNPSRLG